MRFRPEEPARRFSTGEKADLLRGDSVMILGVRGVMARAITLGALLMDAPMFHCRFLARKKRMETVTGGRDVSRRPWCIQVY